MSDKIQHYLDLRTTFYTMQRAGWITDFDITSASPVIHWTDHGRMRCAQLLAIAGELDAGANDWVYFEAAAKFLLPDKLNHAGN